MLARRELSEAQVRQRLVRKEHDETDIDEALRWASNVDEFKLRVQGIATTGDMSRDQMARTVSTSSTGTRAPEITRFGG